MIRPARNAPPWLVARPIAHRGLHEAAAGRIENSPSAARAAMAQGFAIECDVQRTADDDAVVFHDFALDRLTDASGAVGDRSSQALAQLQLKNSTDHIPTLEAFLDLVGGAVPVICEIKSAFDGDMRLAERIALVSASYPGPLAIKSFDPAVIIHLRALGLDRPLGIVSEATFEDAEWRDLTPSKRHELANFLHFTETYPDFLSYHVNDLPCAVPFLCWRAIGLPVMTWTVRTPEQRQKAADWADQMVFEGFIP